MSQLTTTSSEFKLIIRNLNNNKFEVKKMVAIDPICKMEVDEETAKWVSEYKGKKYYFCAPGCKKQFEENPEKYIK